ncbi:pyridoxal-dependent decarboxylase domain-containing protein 1-like [Pollicipes pollicipes]|uniref:pyridoxal-dependent decarboxylase domain-containing protein 1-like n=1 Tax=Pollicipes pollicipes TaxID=41117 RepID=UPI0018851D82|nr:pyridoxal-dependent decarboxylase domain-containing protein 1-like [Pollicipes pollicipes]
MSLFVPSPNCDSLVAMVRMRLHARYSSYAAVGYEALYARPPVVYVSAACRPAAVTALMTSLGLPGGAVRQVPLSAAFGLAHAMDVAQLQRMMDEDESAQKVPLLVMRTPDLGHVDNLRRVTELCRERGVWCHVTGPSLAALALAAVAAASDGADAGSCRLWTALLSLGRRGVVERIHSALALAAAIECRVTAVPKLQLLSARPGKEVAPVADIDKLLSQSVNFTVVLESLSPVVVFRYNNDAVDDMAYLDNLNSWVSCLRPLLAFCSSSTLLGFGDDTLKRAEQCIFPMSRHVM